jgi:hypothetical protein
MLTILRRAVFPLLLVIAGVAAAIYGVKYHVTTVLEERTSEVKIKVPAAFSPNRPSGGGMGPMNGLPDMGGMPEMIEKTVTKKSLEEISLLDPAMIRDATIGGLRPAMISKNGKRKSEWALVRTYSGKPPSLCPT